MAPVMTRGVTGQRDEEHLRFFASDLCQKAKKVLLEIPGASPVLCCQVGFFWGHSCLFTRIFNCFFPFSNVFTAMGRVRHEPGTKMSIPDFLQPRRTGESWQLSVQGKAKPAFQREKGHVPHGWPGGAEQCWPLLASKASPHPRHSQNVGVQGSHMDAGSRAGSFGGDFRWRKLQQGHGCRSKWKGDKQGIFDR